MTCGMLRVNSSYENQILLCGMHYTANFLIKAKRNETMRKIKITCVQTFQVHIFANVSNAKYLSF